MISIGGLRERAQRGTRHEKLTLAGRYPEFATRMISSLLELRWPAYRMRVVSRMSSTILEMLTHLVAMIG